MLPKFGRKNAQQSQPVRTAPTMGTCSAERTDRAHRSQGTLWNTPSPSRRTTRKSMSPMFGRQHGRPVMEYRLTCAQQTPGDLTMKLTTHPKLVAAVMARTFRALRDLMRVPGPHWTPKRARRQPPVAAGNRHASAMDTHRSPAEHMGRSSTTLGTRRATVFPSPRKNRRHMSPMFGRKQALWARSWWEPQGNTVLRRFPLPS